MQAFHQALFAVFIEQETDRAAVHAEDGFFMCDAVMQCAQHQSVPAERDYDISFIQRCVAVALDQGVLAFLRLRRVCGVEMDFHEEATFRADLYSM